MTYTNNTDLQTKISAEIEAFISSAPHIVPTQRGQQLFNITRLLTSALGCADEKVSVASSAADISDKHKLRLDSDYTKLESGEISELIRFGPADHPAFVHGSTMGMSRSESRRLAIAQAKKNDEELQDWRKEQIGRRGQLVANEEQKARGAARKKAALLAVAGQGQGGIMGNGMGSGGGGGNGGLGMGPGGSVGGGGGGGISGRGTPPRGGTPLGDIKKSHHKKKPPRGDDENPGQKRKHPNQYTYSYECVWLTFADMRMRIGMRLLEIQLATWMTMGLVIRQMKFKMNFDTVTAMVRVMEKWSLVIARNVNANGMYILLT